jgi:hypothetical protein
VNGSIGCRVLRASYSALALPGTSVSGISAFLPLLPSG